MSWAGNGIVQFIEECTINQTNVNAVAIIEPATIAVVGTSENTRIPVGIAATSGAVREATRPDNTHDSTSSISGPYSPDLKRASLFFPGCWRPFGSSRTP